MAQAVFDNATAFHLYFRVANAQSKDFTFTSGGVAYSLASVDFQLNIKAYKGASTNVLQLTEGAGLSIASNVLTVTLTEVQTNIAAKLYYWELYDATAKKTWLCGNAYFTEGEPANQTDSAAVTVSLDPDTVSVTVSASGGGASAINDLSDVTITSAASGDILYYNGTAWVNTDSLDGGTL